jgi:hypothetical protein
MASVVLGLVSAAAMAIVVATAPNNYPTPTDRVWGHVMPRHAGDTDLALIALSAMLFGISAASTYRRRRVLAGMSASLISGCILLLLSILIWRLHSPVSAGNGG